MCGEHVMIIIYKYLYAKHNVQVKPLLLETRLYNNALLMRIAFLHIIRFLFYPSSEINAGHR